MLSRHTTISPLAESPSSPACEDVPDLAAAYEAFYADIERYVRRLSRDAETAEDLAQESFVRLWVAFGEGRMPDNPLAWLYRVARNLVVSEARHREVARRLDPSVSATDGGPTPEEVCVGREQLVRLNQAISGMTTTGREVLLLAAEGYSGREMAALTGRTEAALRTQLCRARTRVRAQLAAATSPV